MAQEPLLLTRPRRPGLFARFRANFLTGLIVVAPVGLTVWLIWTVVGWIDAFVLPLVPNRFQPDEYLGVNFRGVGVVFFLFFTAVIGWIAKGYIGRSVIRVGERLVERTPVVRPIYNGVKQIAETILAQSESSFDRACLIEYPRRGIWAIAFISTDTKGEIMRHDPAGEPMVSVFVPTTPNPTSGFLLFFPKSDIIELEMSVEDAAKLVISAGLVYPTKPAPPLPDPETEPPRGRIAG